MRDRAKLESDLQKVYESFKDLKIKINHTKKEGPYYGVLITEWNKLLVREHNIKININQLNMMRWKRRKNG